MKNNNLLPNLYGIFEVKSLSQGRIRMEINKLKNNLELIENLKENLSKIKLIKKFKIVPSLGSLTVEFDDREIDAQFMIGIILKLLGLEAEIFKKRTGKLKYSINDFLNFSDIAIYNKTKGLFDTRTLIAALFLLYGIRKLKTRPMLPTGATLIWWAYNLFTKDMKENGE
ncbi:HMA2 domain-containing protein [Fusobacterium russii]|uniref:HMA2 domain-containing protein n=1 Tax=Fusobacterium russii TaxID=854 RepID=UPI0003998F20|nr:hypothetical protein [Fusobacterium russii]